MFWWSFPPQRETKSTLYKPCLVAKLMVAAVFGRCCRRPCACISVMQSLSMEKKLAWFLKPLNTFIIYRLSKPPIYFCFWYHYWIHSHLCWSLFRMSWVHVLVGVWSLSSQYIHPTDRCRLKSAECVEVSHQWTWTVWASTRVSCSTAPTCCTVEQPL